MNYRYVVHYLYGNIGGQIGCQSRNQAIDMASAIDLWVETKMGLSAEISIQDVETGDVVPFF